MSPPLLLRWRWAIARRGPASSTTRHVLLTLSLHMDVEGQGAWPRIATLAAETALSRRAVVTHLAAAVEAGWISRVESKRDGRAWRRVDYTATIPEVVHQVHYEGGAPDDEGSAPDDEGGAPDDEVVNLTREVVHLTHEGRAPDADVPLLTLQGTLQEQKALSFPEGFGEAWDALRAAGGRLGSRAAAAEAWDALRAETGWAPSEIAARCARFRAARPPKYWPAAAKLLDPAREYLADHNLVAEEKIARDAALPELGKGDGQARHERLIEDALARQREQNG